MVAANPVDGGFWLALASAREQRGDFREAIPAYAAALALGEDLPARTMAMLARCHARLGETGAALTRLEAAFQAGLRETEMVRHEEAFAPLRSLPRFQALLGPTRDHAVGRDAGWQADIDYLAREIKRRAYAPFRLSSEAQLDAVVATMLDHIPVWSDARLLIECRRLLTYLGDAHVSLRPDPEDERWRQALPVQFFLFAEGTFIVAAAPGQAALLGHELIAIDHYPIAEIIAAVAATLPRDNHNPQWPRHQLGWRLRELPFLHALGVANAPTEATLTLRDQTGTERAAHLVTDPSASPADGRNRYPHPPGWVFLPDTLTAPLPLTLRRPRAPYWYTYLAASQTVFFQFNAVRDDPQEPLAAFCDRLFAFIAEQPVARLIIDMRWNGGGNTYLEIALIQHLVRARINQRGRLFVIIGRGTFSAAQNGVGMMSRYTEAIFIGEPTGSSPMFIGETIPFTLPYCRAEVNVSDLLWQTTWPDDYRRWLPPMLYTPVTFADFARNHDAALAAILAWETHAPGQ